MSPSGDSSHRWQLLGEPPPDALADARLQAHHAAQIVASVGFTWVEPVADFSHTNMGWLGDLGALVGQPTSGSSRIRAALRVRDLTLLLLAEDGSVTSEVSAAGKTLEDGYQWLASAVETVTGRAPEKPIVRPEHELPPHPTATGQPFSVDPADAFEELARWYSNADLVLREVQAASPQASPVRCWPHHFDIATLLQLDCGQDAETARSIGVGMTPGDHNYPEPYFYATPWPYPESPELPALEANGEWHTAGWTGAVLRGSRLIGAAPAPEQAQQARAFLQSAIQAGRGLVGLAS